MAITTPTQTHQEIASEAIATKLADLRLLQNLMVGNDEMLAQATAGDAKVAERFQKMLDDDRQNISTINEALSKFGELGSPQQKVQDMANKLDQMMRDDSLSLYEKVLQHEGLKHQLVMTGITVHKAAQVGGDRWETLVDPINQVNFLNRAHQEQLKSIIQLYGCRELVGKDPDDSIWAQAEDAIAALKGIFGGLTS